MNPGTVVVAIITGSAAVLIWGAFLVRMIRSIRRGEERRLSMLTMPVVGFLASLGTLASAFGYAAQGGFVVVFDPQVLTLIASMGRGALMMGGLIAFCAYPHGHGGK